MYRRMSNSTPGQSMGIQSSPMPMQTPPLHMQQALQQQQQMQQTPQIPPTASSLEDLIAQGPTAQSPSVKFTNMEQMDMINKGMPITGDTLQYLNGFLRTQIGRRVRVEFLIGTNTLTDKTGILLGVGINYILINETDTDDLTACDFYNIKFVKFYY